MIGQFTCIYDKLAETIEVVLVLNRFDQLKQHHIRAIVNVQKLLLSLDWLHHDLLRHGLY